MRHLTMLALAALLLAPLASADAASGATRGGPVEWHCDHDSPTTDSQQHDTYCYVIIGGFMYVIHTDELHQGPSASTDSVGGTPTTGSAGAGPLDGVRCAPRAHEEIHCHLWLVWAEVCFTDSDPEVLSGAEYWNECVTGIDTTCALGCHDSAASAAAPDAGAPAATSLVDPLAGGCAGLPAAPGCEVYCRTHHDYGDCWITAGGFQYRLVLWRPCSTC